MGLFSNRKKDQDKPQEGQSTSSQSQPPQKSSDQHSAPSPSGQRSKGPTPPGGLLPNPGWEIGETRKGISGSQRRDSAPRGSDYDDLPATTPPASEPPQRKPSGETPPSAPKRGRPTSSENPSDHPTIPLEVVPKTENERDEEQYNNVPAPASIQVSAQGTMLEKLLLQAVDQGASDLHFSRGVPPTIRLDGYLVPLDHPKLSRADCENLIFSCLNKVQREKFSREWELDFSIDLPEAGRFRVNIHRQRGVVEAAFRVVNDVILPLRRLGLPGVVEELARKHTGMILVTGPTGSGKTTTLASIVDQINSERQEMIITVEDPIEYVHKNKRSIVKQREISSDTLSFSNALRHVLRQDPDVIVVGEMRDLETISTALMAAETGHLVFATLHTPDATQTIDRIIDVFPPHQQEQTRIQVANTLQAIVAQQLLPVPGNRGRVVAVEVLIATTAVKKIIRSGKSEQLYTTMQTNWEAGMITMDKSLKTLYQQGLVSFDDAMARCKFPQEFDNL